MIPRADRSLFRRSNLRALAMLVVLAGASCTRSPAPGPSATVLPAVITTSSGVAMVLVPAGRFLMGGAEGARDELPPHEVDVSAFYMDRTEVTQASFEKTTGYNPSKRERKEDAVDQIRWTEAVDYCNERSKAEGLQPAYDLETGACDFAANGYRLPTEAEWEYACRAGTTTRYFFGDEALALDLYGWYEKNSPKETRPVGARKPNPWGLHDMAGSLLEWCNDRYGEAYYAVSPSKDPAGPAEGGDRVLRGGCWRMKAGECRSAVRFHDEPSNADSCFGWDSYGFRCVRRAS